MEILYKFYSDESEYATLNLENGIVSFSSIDSLNDPFEGIGTYLYRTFENERALWSSLNCSNFPKVMEEMALEDGYHMMTFQYRIFSTTKEFDNPLLWAYYANSHKGFCVGYDKKSISNISDEIFDINYCDTMLHFEEFDAEACKKLLSIKSTEWRIENECRALYIVKKSDISHLPYNDTLCESIDSKKLYRPCYSNDMAKVKKTIMCTDKYISLKCPPTVIYLGLRMNSKKKKQLIDIAKKHRIKVYQMTQKSGSFGFVPQEIG